MFLRGEYSNNWTVGTLFFRWKWWLLHRPIRRTFHTTVSTFKSVFWSREADWQMDEHVMKIDVKFKFYISTFSSRYKTSSKIAPKKREKVLVSFIVNNFSTKWSISILISHICREIVTLFNDPLSIKSIINLTSKLEAYFRLVAYKTKKRVFLVDPDQWYDWR